MSSLSNIYKVSTYSLIPDDEKCPICLCDFIEKDADSSTIVETTCNHLFHKSCLSKWFEKDILNIYCPLCRTPLVEQEEIEKRKEENSRTLRNREGVYSIVIIEFSSNTPGNRSDQNIHMNETAQRLHNLIMNRFMNRELSE